MSPRCEIQANVEQAGVGANTGEEHVPPLPPPPQVSAGGRGVGGVPQAPGGAQFGEFPPLIQAMSGAFQAAIAGVQDIEKSLGERKKEDVVKRTASPSALRKPRKKAQDRQFRSDQRPGGFGHGSCEQSLTGVGAGLPFCDKCGRRHSGECWRSMGACLGCGSKDHKWRDCLKFVGESSGRVETVALGRGRGRGRVPF
ncbi:hypothetical protein V6N13_009048 [Hibiscus sabdariffa]|uniref:CCHC-type domain-containing protein n=1 Tax=Hibiscus sabdariffa TaxID=183260 RepID=A0ABR2NGP2_9ROSI